MAQNIGNALSTFTYAGNDLRVIDRDGNPWFVAKDVCQVLDLGWDKSNQLYAPSRVVKHLNPDEKGSTQVASSGQHLLMVSESGLYKLIMRSDKPAARAFQDWVTRDVLPAIRKDGAYIMGEEKVAKGEMDDVYTMFWE